MHGSDAGERFSDNEASHTGIVAERSLPSHHRPANAQDTCHSDRKWQQRGQNRSGSERPSRKNTCLQREALQTAQTEWKEVHGVAFSPHLKHTRGHDGIRRRRVSSLQRAPQSCQHWLFFCCLTASTAFIEGTWRTATLAGNGNDALVDGMASASSLSNPRGLAISEGMRALYLCDSGSGSIRRFDLTTGVVSTVPGSFGTPIGITVLNDTAAVISSHSTHGIYVLNLTSSSASALAGSGTARFADGFGSNSSFSNPSGLAGYGNRVLIADTGNHRIREVTVSTGQVVTIAGSGIPGYSDGAPDAAQFLQPFAVTVDTSWTFVVVADSGNRRVRMVTLATGFSTTIAGSGQPGQDDGPGTMATFSQLNGIAFSNSESRVLVADGYRIRAVDLGTGRVTTIAGSGVGYRDGIGLSAAFREVYAVLSTRNGTAIVVSDVADHRLRVLRNCSDEACPARQGRECALNYSLGGDDECQCLPGPSNSVTVNANCSWACTAGFFLSNTSATCVPCPPSSNSSVGSTRLASCVCASSSYLDLGAATCEPCLSYPTGGCAAGQFWVPCEAQAPSACSNCSNGLTSVAGSVGAAACGCAAGYSGSNCTACPAGTFKATVGNASCTACPLNSTSEAGTTDLAQCQCGPGLYGAETGVCQPCPLGTYKNFTGTDNCTACPNNTMTLSEGNADRAGCVCQWDYYGLAFARTRNESTCFNVSVANASASSGSGNLNSSTNYTTVCETAVVNFYPFAAGFRPCTPCPFQSVAAPGSFARRDCTCPYGYLGAPGQSCVQCPANSNTSGLALVAEDCKCNPGFYDVNVTANASGLEFECLPCPVGSAKTFAGRGQCTGCGAIDPLSNTSTAGGDDCRCLPGTELVDGLCTLCSPGRFKNVSGDFNCSSCPTGSYQPSSGARMCLPCPANTYNNLPGNPRSQCFACRPCPANSEAPPGTSLRSRCQCSPGYTGRPGETCTACPAGKYKSLVGDSECLSCSDVGDNLWTEEGAAVCGCNIGYNGPLEGPCTACPFGTSKGTVGDDYCTLCAAGTYAERTSAAVSCLVCVNGSSSPLLSVFASSCTCDAGYTGNPPASICSACHPGSFKANPGSSACDTCPGDSYQPLSASSGCIECPDRTQSAPNSTSFEDCGCFPGFTSTVVYNTSNGTQIAVGENCTKCAANTYKREFGRGACTPCQNFSTSPRGSLRCSCDDGYTQALDDEDVCKLCTPYPAGGCPQNTFWKTCDELDSACVPCPSNSGSPNASLSISDCFCIPGYEGDRSLCSPCRAATFKGFSGSESCALCESGFYQDEEASTSCILCTPLQRCPDGQYWDSCPGDQDGHCALCTREPANAHFSGPGVPLWEDNCPSACDEGYVKTNGACTPCEVGQYRSVFQTSCQDCEPPTTNTAPGSGFCTKCEVGFYLVAWDYFGHAICERCASPHTTTLEAGAGFADNCRCDIGYSGFSWSCQRCPAGSFKTTVSVTPDIDMFSGVSVAADNCTLCPAGKFSNVDGQVSDVCGACPAFSDAVAGSSQCSCNAGYYDSDAGFVAACVACPENTFNEVRGRIGVEFCAQCPDVNHYSPSASGLATDCICNIGFFGDELACSLCPNGTFGAVRGLRECSVCDNGTVTLNPLSTNVTDCRCPANTYGNYPVDLFCSPCPNNSFTLGPDKRLRAECTCNQGYFGDLADANASCSTCPENMFPWESLYFCSCNAGFYHNLTRVYVSTFHSSTNTSTLTPTNTTLGNNVCLRCPPNSTSKNAADGLWGCFCEPGFYGSPELGLACQPCPASSNSPQNSQQLASCSCNSGFAGDPGNNITCAECVQSDPNAFTWSNTINCSCNAGFFGFSIATTNTTCQACPPGTYNDETSQTRNVSCFACPANSASFAASTTIFNCTCNGGYYREVVDVFDMICLRCPAATYSNVSGLVSSSQCQQCPSFATSAQATLVISECQCSPGYYGPDGEDCTPCPNNTFNAEIGKVNVSDCLPCPSNASSVPGSTDCVCNAGFYGDPRLNVPCKPCDQDTYQPFTNKSSQDSCLPCPGNFSFARNASTTCLCLPSYYGRPVSGVLCRRCPDNATSSEGAASIAQCGCDVGFYGSPGNNVSCVSCPALAVTSVGATSVLGCDCPAGFFGDPGRNVSCMPCPLNATSNVGATSVAGCFCVAGTHGKPACNVSCTTCPGAAISSAGSTTLSDCLCLPGFYGTAPGGASARVEVDCTVTTTTTTPSFTTTIAMNETNATTTTSMFSTSAPFTTPVRRRLLAINATNGANATANTTNSIDETTILDGFCRLCPDNAVSSLGSTNLSNCTCATAYYGDPLAGIACRPCPAMSTSPQGSKNLTDCACMPGFYGSPVQNVTCLPCTGNSTSSLGSVFRSNCSCNAGYFGDAAVYNRSGASCQPCPANTYNPNTDQIPSSACQSCAVNSTSLAASTDVGQCSCDAGFYGDLTSVAACSACPLNTFNAFPGRRFESNCRPCPINAVTLSEASDEPSDCVCDKGYYRFDIAGEMLCLPCPSGTFGAVRGQTHIRNCTQCPAFTNSMPASMAASACTCNAGYAPNGTAGCVSCPNNTYAPIQNSSTCLSCPNSSSSSPGSDRCDCLAGFYAEGLTRCEPCPQATYGPLPGLTNVSACLACPLGSNTTSTGAVASTSCLCSAGFYGLPGTCSACDAGTFNSLSNQSSVAACVSCAANFTSVAGSAGCRALQLVNGTLV